MVDIKGLLDAVSTALSVIKTVANTPGVNLLPYANTVAGAIDAIQFAFEKGISIAGYVVALKDTFSNGVPSQDKLDALDARIAELRAKIHAPLPPKEDGEPD